MKEKQSLPDSRIISCLKTDYGIQVATLTFLPLGADIHASIYKVQASDQVSYFVKVKRGHHPDTSVAIVELLHKAAIQQIIPPIKNVHGKPTQRIEDFTLIVYPFVEGEDGFRRDLTDHQWFELGKALKQVHEIDVPLSIKAQIRREAYSPKWREVIRSLYPQLDVEPVDEIAAKLLQFMNKNILAIRRLVDRAEQLSHQLHNHPSKFVLCHSDIHAGNVLLGRDDAIYIVDWDEPIMAPKERDLMFIGGGVGNVWNKPNEEPLFYKGYGKTEIDLTLLAYYRHERIVEDIAVYGQELLLTKARGEYRSEMYKQFVDMFEPRGVVDIAFKTDSQREK